MVFITSFFFHAILTTKPLVFSSGLYNTIPNFAYRNLFSNIQNTTIITPSFPLTRRNFENLCDQHEQDKLPLIAHSSIDPDILNSHRIEKALLIDPATLPAIGTSGLIPITIQPRAPVNVILSKFYASFVKTAFQPNIQGASLIQLDYGGHSDLLDGFLPLIAQQIGIHSDTENIKDYKYFVKLYIQKWITSH